MEVGQRVFKQTVPHIGLSVELATESVPDDGSYHVVLNGEVVFSSPSKTRALRQYRTLRDEALAKLGPPTRVVDRAAALHRA
jgi:hypothetical protein